MRRARAFTLVEILVVVVLLGILAGIVIPSIARSGVSARESVMSANLAMLRRFVVIYASHHQEVAPGYPGGDPGGTPTNAAFCDQATLASTVDGQTAARGTPGYPYGPYLSKIPTNPLNDLDTIEMLANGQDFPPAADDNFGWIYKAATGEMRSDSASSDETGTRYYDY